MVMKFELDMDKVLGLEYDEEGEPVGQRTLRSEIIAAVVSNLTQEARRDVTNAVLAKVGEVLDDEIRSLIREVMAEPIQRTTPWGERKGEPATIREMIRTSLESFLSGTTAGRDNYGNRKPENLRQLIDEATRETLTTELRQTVSEAKKQINSAITQKAVQAAVTELSKAVKV